MKSDVKQLSAFEKLISFCVALGALYNPNKESLQIAALNALLALAQQSLEALKTLRIEYDKAVKMRGKHLLTSPNS